MTATRDPGDGRLTPSERTAFNRAFEARRRRADGTDIFMQVAAAFGVALSAGGVIALAIHYGLALVTLARTVAARW